MNKLTAEVARQDLNHLKSWVETCGISIKEERYMQALEIALPVLEQQESQCQKCGDTGHMDSGGTQPWGEPIMVECDCQFEQQEKDESWTKWNGHSVPVELLGSVVTVKFADGYVHSGPARHFYWGINCGNPIVAYRALEQQERERGEEE